jgi:hypothetical protein
LLQEDEYNPSVVSAEYQDDYIDEEEYPEIHSRVKVYQQRRPVFANRPQNQRFLFNYILSSLRTTTATFTATSSLTLTVVQSCIAAAKFKDDAAKTTACRRKRDLLDFNPEDAQFVIAPTETQKYNHIILGYLNNNPEFKNESILIVE